MTAAPRSRLVNPLLGNYYGIFASVLAAIVLLLLILEQLGVADANLRILISTGFLGLYCAIGIATFTRLPAEYFASGRRVPAFFSGLNIACTALGGAGLAAIGGALLIAGFDTLCLGIGLVGGFVCMVVLIMPFLRKVGAYSLPGYLGRRFESPTLRLASATALAVPTLLLLVAELKMAASMGAWLTQLSEGVITWMLVLSVALMLVPGGMRSLSWANAAAAIAVLGALFVPVVIVAVMTTYLPIPQMSHGPVLRSLMRLETAQGISAPIAATMAIGLPGPGLEPILHRFATPFSSIGPVAFLLAAIAVMIGTAGSPALLSRAGTTPSVYEVRKSLGWAALVLGIVLMTLSANAVFMRDMIMNQLVGATAQPEWFKTLAGLGFAGIDEHAAPGTLSSFAFKRDTVLLALPIAAGSPASLVYLAAVGIISAALAGASAAAATLGIMLSEDVVRAPRNELASSGRRVLRARAAIGLAVVAGGWISVMTPGDPLEILLWSLAFSGSTAFPVIVLSIWWKRANAWGALAGLVAGFTVTAGSIAAGDAASIGLPGVIASAVGAPAAFAAMLVVSILTPAPGRPALEIVHEMRIPGGETLYDREARLALLQQQRT